MKIGTNVCEGQVSTGLQNSYTLRRITKKESIVVATHDVVAHVRDFEHLSQLLRVPSEHVQKR
jgi:hypothetical protein